MATKLIRNFWDEMNRHPNADYNEQDGLVIEFDRLRLKDRVDRGKVCIWGQDEHECWELLFQETDNFTAMKGTHDDILYRENAKDRVASEDIRWT